MYEETTIAAIATSPGEGGIGIVRISGIRAADIGNTLFRAKKIKDFKDAEPYRMYFGSTEALRETLELALKSGAVPAARGEFTKRAFLNGRIDLAQAEAVMDIISAKGRAALSQAESHLAGALSRFVRECMDELKDLITKLEVTIDYP